LTRPGRGRVHDLSQPLSKIGQATPAREVHRPWRSTSLVGTLVGRFGWSRRDVAFGVLEGLLYLALAFLLLWPVTLHLTDRIVGTGDGEFYLWLGWRLAELVRDGSPPVVIPDVVYPQGYDVSLGDGYGAYLLIGFWNLVVNPYVAVNLTVVTALAANFLSGRRLARVTAPQSRTVWVVTAVAFGTAPPILLRAYGHYHLLFAFVSALVLAEAVIYVREGRPLRFVRIGALLALAFTFSIYWFASSAAALIVVVGVAALQRRDRPETWLRLAASVVIAMVLTAPLTVPRLDFDRRESAAAGDRSLQDLDNEQNAVRFSADALSIIAQPSASRITLPGAARLHRDFYPNRLESTIFPGLLLLVGLFALAFVRDPLRLPVLAAVAVVWVLSLGPTFTIDGRTLLTHDDGQPVRFMPLELLYSLPGTSALRAPSRIAFALPALGAVALAVVAGRLRPRLTRHWQVGVLAAGALFVMTTNLVVLPYTTAELAPPLRRGLETMRAEARAGDTVAEVPFDAAGQYIQAIKFQMVHGLPTLGFHAQHSALPWYSDLREYKASSSLAELRCFPPLVGYAPAQYSPGLRPSGHELAELRRQFGVRFLLVNEALLAEPLCDRRRSDIESIVRPARTLAQGGGWRILELP
jgi:hypothetical protein